MKKMFANVLRKVLRKKYLLLVLREGRMEDLKCYIEYKNKYVMYFDSLLKLWLFIILVTFLIAVIKTSIKNLNHLILTIK